MASRWPFHVGEPPEDHAAHGPAGTGRLARGDRGVEGARHDAAARDADRREGRGAVRHDRRRQHARGGAHEAARGSWQRRGHEAVAHVPDARDAGEPRGEPAVEGGLERVRVHDVGSAARAGAARGRCDVAGGPSRRGARRAGRARRGARSRRRVEREHLDRGARGDQPRAQRAVLGEDRVDRRRGRRGRPGRVRSPALRPRARAVWSSTTTRSGRTSSAGPRSYTDMRAATSAQPCASATARRRRRQRRRGVGSRAPGSPRAPRPGPRRRPRGPGALAGRSERLCEAVGVGAEDGRAAGERLEHDEPVALEGDGGHDGQVRGAVPRDELVVVDAADEPHRDRHPERARRASASSSRDGSVAHDREGSVGAGDVAAQAEAARRAPSAGRGGARRARRGPAPSPSAARAAPRSPGAKRSRSTPGASTVDRPRRDAVAIGEDVGERGREDDAAPRAAVHATLDHALDRDVGPARAARAGLLCPGPLEVHDLRDPRAGTPTAR